jgi:tetratricopeptide (TPR) repeat protein
MGARPDGVFWWGFYTRPSIDEFFEAALAYMSGGRIDPRRISSASTRAQVIGAMLGAGRYLFVMDGLEVMQHQAGDSYGLLRSNDLRDFLQLFCAPGHQSFCLITSRAPLLDLMSYSTYRHRDVTRLSPPDGRALLRRLGVRAHGRAPVRDAALDVVVADWDGHALTLGLLGAYLVERHSGDVGKLDLDDISPPTADEDRYERVHRVLRRYDEHLTEAERAFLTLFSAFRTPVHESAFEKVFRASAQPPNNPTTEPPINAPIVALTDTEFDATIKRLVTYRILRHDPREAIYTAHPLVRDHYLARLTAGGRAQAEDAHERIKDYYLELAGDTPQYPTLDDLAPLIEVVHHACRAGAYDEAWQVYWGRIIQQNRRLLVWQLGAYETTLALTLEFFPESDATQEPLVSSPGDKGFILNRIGLCLMNLGRLAEAAPFYERSNAMASELEDWHNASVGYQNLASLHAYLGALAASADAATRALDLARRAESKQDERNSLAWQAWAAHLQGDLEVAGAAFVQAETLEREIDSTVRYLYSMRGIQNANHLRRAGDPAYACRITEANLEICERHRFIKSISQCHRILGDLDAGDGNDEGARTHYDQALQIARSITFRPALIEALLARGRWAARHLRDAPAAFSDLSEALSYATDGGYRIYEADARVALAWAHLAAARSPRPPAEDGRSAGEGPGVRVAHLAPARAEADRAWQMSEQMGYYWGWVDAEEVRGEIEKERGE